MNVWVNGKMPENVENVFIENGTEIRFLLDFTVENNNNSSNSLAANNSLSSPSSETLLLSRKPSRSNDAESTHFQDFQLQSKNGNAAIRILSSHNKREGIIFSLEVDGQEIPEINDL